LIEGSTSIEQWVILIRLAGFDDRPAFLDHAQGRVSTMALTVASLMRSASASSAATALR
jgi:hypothetical protein